MTGFRGDGLSLFAPVSEPKPHSARMAALQTRDEELTDVLTGPLTAAEMKTLERRRKAVKSAGRYLLYGEPLSKKAAVHRTTEGETFEQDVIDRLEHQAEKRGWSGIMETPVAGIAVRLPNFGSLALEMVEAAKSAEPKLPPVVE